ncbi:hypothetical protein HG530_011895 [Fusarium avenaceum]|nr:hypothetical protein HG530_011895 [Fusarium avenaceum]
MRHGLIPKLILIGCHVHELSRDLVPRSKSPVVPSALIHAAPRSLAQLILKILDLLLKIPDAIGVHNDCGILQLIDLAIARFQFTS